MGRTYFARKVIVGVHLYREGAGSVDKLYEQRELVAVADIVEPSEQCVFMPVYEQRERKAAVRSGGNGGDGAGDA